MSKPFNYGFVECSVPNCTKRLRNRKTEACDMHDKRYHRNGSFELATAYKNPRGSVRDHIIEYRAWHHMKTRCYNTNYKGYHNYGGRGIKVCDEWLSSFKSFLDYIGRRPSPSHSIDRIDNNGNYEPGNVRWANWSEQANNRRPRTCRVYSR